MNDLLNIDIRNLLKKHNFSKPKNSFIFVLRETDKELNFQKNNSNNNCDSILLINYDSPDYVIHAWLSGRSLTHKKYQDRMVKGTARANYIASGFYSKAWRKGHHRGYPALVQNKSFVIFRSKDMELKDEDDYPEYNTIVADNFHGWAPMSAGCVTVRGSMKHLTEDWKKAHDWIYYRNKNQTFFSVCILEHEDIESKGSLKPGSRGQKVFDLQEKLGIKADGDFGPITHKAFIST